MLLLRSAGAFLLRLAERRLIALLFQAPPRRTRAFGREPAERVVFEKTRPQPVSIGMPGVSDPALNPRTNLVQSDRPSREVSLHRPQTSAKPLCGKIRAPERNGPEPPLPPLREGGKIRDPEPSFPPVRGGGKIRAPEPNFPPSRRGGQGGFRFSHGRDLQLFKPWFARSRSDKPVPRGPPSQGAEKTHNGIGMNTKPVQDQLFISPHAACPSRNDPARRDTRS